MTQPNQPSRPSAPNKPPPQARQERWDREAEALRANLKKRKQQARARETVEAIAEESKR